MVVVVVVMTSLAVTLRTGACILYMVHDTYYMHKCARTAGCRICPRARARARLYLCVPVNKCANANICEEIPFDAIRM